MEQFLKLDLYDKTMSSLGKQKDLVEATCVAQEHPDFGTESHVMSLQHAREFAIKILELCLKMEGNT